MSIFLPRFHNSELASIVEYDFSSLVWLEILQSFGFLPSITATFLGILPGRYPYAVNVACDTGPVPSIRYPLCLGKPSS